MKLVFHFCHMSSVRGTSDGRGPVTRNRVPDREEQGKPRNDARRGRCHPLEAGIYPCGCHRYRDTQLPSTKYQVPMLRGGSTGSAGGPRQPAETGIDRAENLGPGGGQRTWKPGPDAAVGPTGAQESAPSLFPSGTTYSGKSGGARGGGPRGMGGVGGRPDAGTRHATQPPAGAAAGGRTSTVVACAVPEGR